MNGVGYTLAALLASVLSGVVIVPTLNFIDEKIEGNERSHSGFDGLAIAFWYVLFCAPVIFITLLLYRFVDNTKVAKYFFGGCLVAVIGFIIYNKLNTKPRPKYDFAKAKGTTGQVVTTVPQPVLQPKTNPCNYSHNSSVTIPKRS
jgi:hypothetical protein